MSSLLTELSQTNGNLDSFLDQNKNVLVVLFFSADWSEESKLMREVINELGKSDKNLSTFKFVQIEAEDNEQLALKYQVEAVPTFVFIRNNQVLHTLNGANAPELRKRLNQLSQVPAAASNAKPVDLNARLKNLINMSPVTVFIKGTPQEPRCGFSRQIVDILREQNVEYSYFDILSDDEVREGLKKYSNWPTYPQLYVKGELIGGLDIIKEMIQNGEFQDVIPKKDETLNERLKKLLNQSKIMLFIKGNPREPKCGFSRQIIELLNETGQKYDSFDILTDDQVRQGLKEFSNWPTYPQVYVDGELVGGLDIIKELKQSGELETTLQGKSSA